MIMCARNQYNIVTSVIIVSAWGTIYIKTSDSELQGQEEAACTHHQAYTTTTGI